MADLLWDDVSSFFDPDLMGALSDVRVPDVSVEGEAVLPVPRAEVVLSRPVDAECPSLRVWPTADVLAVFRFPDDEVVDFDVDLRELQGQERLDVLCGFFRTIGRRLGSPVLMDAEGAYGRPILGFDVGSDRVALLLEGYRRGEPIRGHRMILKTWGPGPSPVRLSLVGGDVGCHLGPGVGCDLD